MVKDLKSRNDVLVVFIHWTLTRYNKGKKKGGGLDRGISRQRVGVRIGKGYFQTEGGVEDWKGVFSD